jgi:hypothetical protein
MSIETVTRKNKRILHIKYAGLAPAAMLDQIRAATKAIVDSGSTENLVLTDMTGSFVGEDFVELAKAEGKKSLPFCRKSAIVGITGIKKILLKGVNAISPKPRVPFDTVEEALEWLAE